MQQPIVISCRWQSVFLAEADNLFLPLGLQEILIVIFCFIFLCQFLAQNNMHNFTYSIVKHWLDDIQDLTLPLVLHDFLRNVDHAPEQFYHLIVLIESLFRNEVLQLRWDRFPIDGIRTKKEQTMTQNGIQNILRVNVLLQIVVEYVLNVF